MQAAGVKMTSVRRYLVRGGKLARKIKLHSFFAVAMLACVILS